MPKALVKKLASNGKRGYLDYKSAYPDSAGNPRDLRFSIGDVFKAHQVLIAVGIEVEFDIADDKVKKQDKAINIKVVVSASSSSSAPPPHATPKPSLIEAVKADLLKAWQFLKAKVVEVKKRSKPSALTNFITLALLFVGFVASLLALTKAVAAKDPSSVALYGLITFIVIKAIVFSKQNMLWSNLQKVILSNFNLIWFVAWILFYFGGTG